MRIATATRKTSAPIRLINTESVDIFDSNEECIGDFESTDIHIEQIQRLNIATRDVKSFDDLLAELGDIVFDTSAKTLRLPSIYRDHIINGTGVVSVIHDLHLHDESEESLIHSLIYHVENSIGHTSAIVIPNANDFFHQLDDDQCTLLRHFSANNMSLKEDTLVMLL